MIVPCLRVLQDRRRESISSNAFANCALSDIEFFFPRGQFEDESRGKLPRSRPRSNPPAKRKQPKSEQGPGPAKPKKGENQKSEKPKGSRPRP